MERGKNIFYLLVHFLRSCKIWCWTKLKPGARNCYPDLPYGCHGLRHLGHTLLSCFLQKHIISKLYQREFGLKIVICHGMLMSRAVAYLTALQEKPRFLFVNNTFLLDYSIEHGQFQLATIWQDHLGRISSYSVSHSQIFVFY